MVISFVLMIIDKGGRNVQIYLYQLRKEKGITQKDLKLLSIHNSYHKTK